MFSDGHMSYEENLTPWCPFSLFIIPYPCKRYELSIGMEKSQPSTYKNRVFTTQFYASLRLVFEIRQSKSSFRCNYCFWLHEGLIAHHNALHTVYLIVSCFLKKALQYKMVVQRDFDGVAFRKLCLVVPQIRCNWFTENFSSLEVDTEI